MPNFENDSVSHHFKYLTPESIVSLMKLLVIQHFHRFIERSPVDLETVFFSKFIDIRKRCILLDIDCQIMIAKSPSNRSDVCVDCIKEMNRLTRDVEPFYDPSVNLFLNATKRVVHSDDGTADDRKTYVENSLRRDERIFDFSRLNIGLLKASYISMHAFAFTYRGSNILRIYVDEELYKWNVNKMRRDYVTRSLCSGNVCNSVSRSRCVTNTMAEEDEVFHEIKKKASCKNIATTSTIRPSSGSIDERYSLHEMFVRCITRYFRARYDYNFPTMYEPACLPNNYLSASSCSSTSATLSSPQQKSLQLLATSRSLSSSVVPCRETREEQRRYLIKNSTSVLSDERYYFKLDVDDLSYEMSYDKNVAPLFVVDYDYVRFFLKKMKTEIDCVYEFMRRLCDKRDNEKGRIDEDYDYNDNDNVDDDDDNDDDIENKGKNSKENFESRTGDCCEAGTSEGESEYLNFVKLRSTFLRQSRWHDFNDTVSFVRWSQAPEIVRQARDEVLSDSSSFYDLTTKFMNLLERDVNVERVLLSEPINLSTFNSSCAKNQQNRTMSRSKLNIYTYALRETHRFREFFVRHCRALKIFKYYICFDRIDQDKRGQSCVVICYEQFRFAVKLILFADTIFNILRRMDELYKKFFAINRYIDLKEASPCNETSDKFHYDILI